MTSFREFIQRYRANGWQTVPNYRPDPATGACSCPDPTCGSQGKHPVGRFWPGGSADPADYDGRNLGVGLGPESNHLADADLDCTEAVAVATLLLPPTDAAFGRGGQVRHWLYVIGDGTAAYAKLQDPVLPSKEATIVELRWPEWDAQEHRYKNIQTVFPPSLHVGGDTLAWDREGPPAQAGGADLGRAVRRVGAAVLIARYAKPKERHALVLLLANLGVRAGWDDDLVLRFIIAVFTAKNDQDKVAKITNGEGVGAIADARKRMDTGKPMTGLPALKEMLDPALTAADTDQVVARIREWIGLPDTEGAPTAWEPPVPLPELGVALPFPLHLFPPQVADYWRAAADALHAPVDYVAAPGVARASAY